MRVYISGPMSGLPNHNYEAFAEAAHWLRQHFCENVVSPHEVAADCGGCRCDQQRAIDRADHTPYLSAQSHDWHAHMKADIAALLECDIIVLLPGWQMSKGARLELTIAMELGFTVFFREGGGEQWRLVPMGRE